jgi:rsbT co-antagonist protein RsbR
MTTGDPPTRFTNEDRSLLRRIGSHLMHIMQGQPAGPLEVERRDEIGILAAMVDRAAEMLAKGRERDRRHRAELEARVQELEQAHATQARLLETIRSLSMPILSVSRDVELVPIIGGLDAARGEEFLERLLERVSAAGARVVILDVTGAESLDDAVAARLLSATRAVRLLGAEVILCGVSPALARAAVRLDLDLSALRPQRDLAAAIASALGLSARAQRA